MATASISSATTRAWRGDAAGRYVQQYFVSHFPLNLVQISDDKLFQTDRRGCKLTRNLQLLVIYRTFSQIACVRVQVPVHAGPEQHRWAAVSSAAGLPRVLQGTATATPGARPAASGATLRQGERQHCYFFFLQWSRSTVRSHIRLYLAQPYLRFAMVIPVPNLVDCTVTQGATTYTWKGYGFGKFSDCKLTHPPLRVMTWD